MKVYVDCSSNEARLTFELWKHKNVNKVERLYARGCEKCKVNKSVFPNVLQIHHVDGDKRNNRLSNLMCLCSNCHKEVHKNLCVVYADRSFTLKFLFTNLAKDKREVIDKVYDFYINLKKGV